MPSKAPNPPLGLAILRVVTGIVFIAHGAAKLFGGGVAGTGEFFANLGIPLAGVAAWVVTFLEFFGGLALLGGVLVVPIAVLLAIQMFVGIVLVHAQNGFFVIGPGQGGIELNLLLIAALLTLVFAGPGAAALGGRSGGDLIEARDSAGDAGDRS